MRRTLWLFPLLIVGFVLITALRPSADVTAQSDAACQRQVAEAVATVADSCEGLGRNQACYGNTMVEAELNPDFTVRFEESGDTTDLLSLARLSTTPFDSEAGEWGIALLQAQVNLPDALPGQNVTFLLYGDAALDNPTPDMRAVRLTTSLTEDINCADAPPSALVVQAPRGTQVTLTLNGADIILGSTAYITAEFPEMTVATVDGVVVVSAFGFIRVIQPGEQVFLPIDEEGMIEGGPSEVEPYSCEQVARSPFTLLPEAVELPACEGEATLAPGAPSATATRRAAAPTATRPAGPPTLTPSVACTPRTDWIYYYIVQPGDTLSNIGQRIGFSPFTLAAGNCIANPNVIFVNQVLRVPVSVPPRPTITRTPTPTVTMTMTVTPPTGANTQADLVAVFPGS